MNYILVIKPYFILLKKNYNMQMYNTFISVQTGVYACFYFLLIIKQLSYKARPADLDSYPN